MRVLLVVGKGGVGKTTLAAATALAAARDGARTLVVSTDPAHSLTDVLGLTGAGRAGEWRASAAPTPVPGATGSLDVLQIDTRARLDTAWTTLRGLVADLLGGIGVDPVLASEIAAVPGVDDVLALLEVADHAEGYDAVVVDCAPTAETLRLLALPEAFERLVARGLPVDRRIARLMSGAGLTDGTVAALAALDDLAARLLAVRELLTGPRASVRIVTTPERVVLAEAARSRSTLAMLGHHVDGVVVNRVAVGEQWPPGVVARHRDGLVAARDTFAELPVRVSPHTDAEPLGPEALLALADGTYAGGDPLDLGAVRAGDAVTTDGSAWFLEVPVPGASLDDVDVAVTDAGDLVVDLGPHRRVVALPSVLRRCDVTGATLDLTDRGRVVRVRFDPDSDRWSTSVAAR